MKKDLPRVNKSETSYKLSYRIGVEKYCRNVSGFGLGEDRAFA
jgi:hypothetical protein